MGSEGGAGRDVRKELTARAAVATGDPRAAVCARVLLAEEEEGAPPPPFLDWPARASPPRLFGACPPAPPSAACARAATKSCTAGRASAGRALRHPPMIAGEAQRGSASGLAAQVDGGAGALDPAAFSPSALSPHPPPTSSIASGMATPSGAKALTAPPSPSPRRPPRSRSALLQLVRPPQHFGFGLQY